MVLLLFIVVVVVVVIFSFSCLYTLLVKHCVLQNSFLEAEKMIYRRNLFYCLMRKLLEHYGCKSHVTDATLLANNMQHCWAQHVAFV